METKRYQVEVEKFAEKQIDRLPLHIQEKLGVWLESVERAGLPEVRKAPGYHDEPLRGGRAGQRSVRLNRSYRVIYEERPGSTLVIVAIIEVNKHDY